MRERIYVTDTAWLLMQLLPRWLWRRWYSRLSPELKAAWTAKGLEMVTRAVAKVGSQVARLTEQIADFGRALERASQTPEGR